MQKNGVAILVYTGLELAAETLFSVSTSCMIEPPGELILVIDELLPALEVPPIFPVNKKRYTVDVPGTVTLPVYINFFMPGSGLAILLQVVLPACAGQTGVTSTP